MGRKYSSQHPEREEFDADEIACHIVLKIIMSGKSRGIVLEPYTYLAPMMYIDFFDLIYYTDRILYKTYLYNSTHPTFFSGWESRSVSEKWLIKASDLLERKKNLYRKDYELKIAVLFSFERFYLHNGEISEAFKCLDNAEHILTCLPDQQSYREVYESIHEARAALNERRVL